MRELTSAEHEALKNFDFNILCEECSDGIYDNIILGKSLLVKNALEKKLLDSIEGKITENVIDILLRLMGIIFAVDKNYRKNIIGFNATYVFTDKSNNFYSAAVFNNGRLKVSDKKISDPTFTLIFRDNQSLVKLLFSGAPDILNAMLNQEVDFEGNVNYINKFAYMALHLVLELTGGQVFA